MLAGCKSHILMSNIRYEELLLSLCDQKPKQVKFRGYYFLRIMTDIVTMASNIDYRNGMFTAYSSIEYYIDLAS